MPTSSKLTSEGPQTTLSICSKPGVKWVNDRLGNEQFGPIAARLVQDITRRLRLLRSVPASRTPEPPAEDAWKYANGTYFTCRLEAAH